jgi:hypothetical protein
MIKPMVLIAVCGTAAWSTAAPAPAAADPLRRAQWYLDTIHADAAQRVADGAGVLVAVIDTGVDADHPDLRGAVVAGRDLVDSTGSDHDPNGHGTHVAGIIAARAGNGIGIEGAAPGARILTIRALDADGSGDTGMVAAAVDEAVTAGAKVINLSLGPTANVIRSLSPLDPLVAAVKRAVNADVAVVAAAGNQGLPVCAQPSSLPEILCVEAVTRDLSRAAYSNYGMQVDVVAPGGDDSEAIRSTYKDGDYADLMGTSQATPQVAAAAAMLISLGLSAHEAVTRIESSATDLGPRGVDLEFGHGLLDIQAAMGGLAPRAPTLVSTRVPRSITIRSLLRRGLRVRCRLAGTGPCQASLDTEAGRHLGHGSRNLRANDAGTVTVRVTTAGRRVLRAGHSLDALVTARGADDVTRTQEISLDR